MVFTDIPHYLYTTVIKKYHPKAVYRQFIYSFLLIASIAIATSSCKVYQPTHYFQNIQRDTVITGFVNTVPELNIQKGDILAIKFSSLSPEEDALFNSSITTAETVSGFPVDNDGNIYLHKLGKTSVAGLSRNALKNKLETALIPFLKDAIVTVNFANHRITVFGETSSTVVEMPEEKIPLLEVMAKASGVTPDSKLDQVMVIRENGNAKEFKFLNLEDPSIFTSPWYYLQPNDIVVIKPNTEKIVAEQKRTRNQLLYTTLLSSVTFIFLIIDRVTR